MPLFRCILLEILATVSDSPPPATCSIVQITYSVRFARGAFLQSPLSSGRPLDANYASCCKSTSPLTDWVFLCWSFHPFLLEYTRNDFWRKHSLNKVIFVWYPTYINTSRTQIHTRTTEKQTNKQTNKQKYTYLQKVKTRVQRWVIIFLSPRQSSMVLSWLLYLSILKFMSHLLMFDFSVNWKACTHFFYITSSINNKY